MAKKESKKPEKEQNKPKVHKDLSGFEISINQFGEIKSNMNIENINEFLNKNVDDKKLADRGGYDELKTGKKKKSKK